MKLTVFLLVAVFAAYTTANLIKPDGKIDEKLFLDRYPELQNLLSQIEDLYNYINSIVNVILQNGALIGKRESQKLFDSLYALLYPTINPLVQSVSLSLAQTLFAISNDGLSALLPGKREIDAKGLWNFLTDAFHVIYDPIDNAAMLISGMLVHVVAGLAVEGLPAPSGRAIVESQKLFDSLYALLYPTINPLVQSVSLSLAQTLFAISNEGLSAILPGKREIDAKGFFDFLNDAFHVVYDPINNAAMLISGMLVHVVAGLAVEGLPAPSGRAIVESQKLFDSLYALVYPTINPLVQSLSLSLAQTLFAISNDGLSALLPGKREIDVKGLWNFLTDAFHVIYDPIDNAAMLISGMLVHVVAGLAVEGLPAPSGRSLFEVSDIQAQKFLDSLYEWIYPTLNPLVQSVSLSLAQTLFAISNDGLSALFGK